MSDLHVFLSNRKGPQRFGVGAATALRGGKLLEKLRTLRGGARRRIAAKLRNAPLDGFAIDAFASMVFNVYLSRRIRQNAFGHWLEGDIMTRKALVPAPPEHASHDATKSTLPKDRSDDCAGSNQAQKLIAGRDDTELGDGFSRAEISYTGPMLGKGLHLPDPGTGARVLEDSVLADSRATPEIIAATASWGVRRAARMPFPRDFEVARADEHSGVRVSFSLPPGSYATSLLREVMKHAIDESSEGADDDDLTEPMRCFLDKESDNTEIRERGKKQNTLPMPPLRPKEIGNDPRFPAPWAVAKKSRRFEQYLKKWLAEGDDGHEFVDPSDRRYPSHVRHVRHMAVVSVIRKLRDDYPKVRF